MHLGGERRSRTSKARSWTTPESSLLTRPPRPSKNCEGRNDWKFSVSRKFIFTIITSLRYKRVWLWSLCEQWWVQEHTWKLSLRLPTRIFRSQLPVRWVLIVKSNTPNANMADRSVGARDESHASEASQALMFCFDNASPEKSCFVFDPVCFCFALPPYKLCSWIPPEGIEIFHSRESVFFFSFPRSST